MPPKGGIKEMHVLSHVCQNILCHALIYQNQILTSRQINFEILKSNSLWVRLNALANRLANINRKIKLSWPNLSYVSF